MSSTPQYPCAQLKDSLRKEAELLELLSDENISLRKLARHSAEHKALLEHRLIQVTALVPEIRASSIEESSRLFAELAPSLHWSMFLGNSVSVTLSLSDKAEREGLRERMGGFFSISLPPTKSHSRELLRGTMNPHSESVFFSVIPRTAIRLIEAYKLPITRVTSEAALDEMMGLMKFPLSEPPSTST